MPAKSKAQYRFMQMILRGFKKLRLKKKAPPRSVAEEFVRETPRPGALPERVSPKRKLKRRKPSKSEPALDLGPDIDRPRIEPAYEAEPMPSYSESPSYGYGVEDYPSPPHKRFLEKHKKLPRKPRLPQKKRARVYEKHKRMLKKLKSGAERDKVLLLKRKRVGGIEPLPGDF